jgi:hypothetical protein
MDKLVKDLNVSACGLLGQKVEHQAVARRQFYVGKVLNGGITV